LAAVSMTANTASHRLGIELIVDEQFLSAEEGGA
jgi:hypothetical protein